MQLYVQLVTTAIGAKQSETLIQSTRHLIGSCQQLLQPVARKVASCTLYRSLETLEKFHFILGPEYRISSE